MLSYFKHEMMQIGQLEGSFSLLRFQQELKEQ